MSPTVDRPTDTANANAPAPAAEATVRGNFVLLRADSLHLLLPQPEISSVDYLESLPVASDQPGILLRPDDERCFVAVSERLAPLSACPPGRFVATSFAAEEDLPLHWCWSEVRIFMDAEWAVRPLPSALLSLHAPFSHYTAYEDGIAYIGSARKIVDFVRLFGW